MKFECKWVSGFLSPESGHPAQGKELMLAVLENKGKLGPWPSGEIAELIRHHCVVAQGEAQGM